MIFFLTGFLLSSRKLTFSHLKMDGCNTSFLLGYCSLFSGAMLVSGSVSKTKKSGKKRGIGGGGPLKIPRRMALNL